MWTWRLSAVAEADIVRLLAITDDRFGALARRRYEVLLVTGLRDLASDPQRNGSVARPGLGDGVRSYHLCYSRERARTGDGMVRQPRHLLLYRLVPPDLIGIGRVLHDRIEIAAHLPPTYGDEP